MPLAQLVLLRSEAELIEDARKERASFLAELIMIRLKPETRGEPGAPPAPAPAPEPPAPRPEPAEDDDPDPDSWEPPPYVPPPEEEDQYRSVLRTRCTLQNINRMFNCDANYLVDNFGNAVWPRNWLKALRSSKRGEQWRYTIVEHDRARASKRDRPEFFDGEIELHARHVPAEVSELALRGWLRYGLMNTPYMSAMEDELELLESQTRAMREKTANLEAVEIRGETLSNVKARELREKMEEFYDKRTLELEGELETLRARYTRERELVKREPIELEFMADEKEDVVHPTASKRWRVRFPGRHGEWLYDETLEGMDWLWVKLINRRPPRYSLQRESELEYEDALALVSMTGVTFEEVRQGAAVLHLRAAPVRDGLTEDELIDSVDTKFSGTWVHGTPQGEGTLVTEAGVFRGRFRDGLAVEGHITMANGDRYDGDIFHMAAEDELDAHKRRPRSVLPGADKYWGCQTPHGRGRLRFADGSVYEGELRHGRIDGEGVYVSAEGYVEEGRFRDGELHGPGGRRVTAQGDVELGRFEGGRLVGKAVRVSAQGDVHKGFFVEGRRRGRSYTALSNGDAFDGFWLDDEPHGVGYAAFGNARRPVGKGHVTDYSVFGEWRSGLLRGGGCLTDHKHVYQDGGPSRYAVVDTAKDHIGGAVKRYQAVNRIVKRQVTREERAKKEAVAKGYEVMEKRTKLEFKNLKRFYKLLDINFRRWGAERRRAARDAELPPERLAELQQLRQERKDAKERQKKLLLKKGIVVRESLRERKVESWGERFSGLRRFNPPKLPPIERVAVGEGEQRRMLEADVAYFHPQADVEVAGKPKEGPTAFENRMRALDARLEEEREEAPGLR